MNILKFLCFVLVMFASNSYAAANSEEAFLHEWTSAVDAPFYSINDKGEKELNIPENLTTWIFEDGTFIPMAKLQDGKSYSFITDHLGTPTEAFDEEGEQVWSRQLDIYGQTRKEVGVENFIPFRYQGQYEDIETGLSYNRFRYYSPESGTYVSQDPIRLVSGQHNLYAYSLDTNIYIDLFGLEIVYRLLRPEENPANGLTAKKPERGMTIHGHVSSGSRNKGSQFISTSKDPTYLADQWYKPGQKMVAIDTDKLGADVQVIDISTREKALAAGVGSGSANLPSKSKEVLLVGHVPASAMEEVDATKFKSCI